MNKIEIKAELRQISRDLNYYMKEYELSQKEAYELIHKKYYIRMRLTQSYVEIEKRNEIYNSFKSEEGGKDGI